MTARARRSKIAPTHWEEHKETIKRIYLTEKRPLEGKNGLIESMRYHGLDATKPQYEAQFTRWGFRKKLNREGWHAIGHRIEARKISGLKSHVYIYGMKVTQEKVKKETARYRLCMTSEDSCEGLTLPEGVIIETQPEQAINSENIMNEQEPTSTNSFASNDDLPDLEMNDVSDEYINPVEIGEVVTSQPQIWEQSDHETSFCTVSQRLSTGVSRQYRWAFSRSQQSDPLVVHDWDSRLILSRHQGYQQFTVNDTAMFENNIPLNTTSLFAHFNEPVFYGIRKLLKNMINNSKSSIGKTMPLLSRSAHQELQRSSPDIVILKQIMFLLMNNFPGSDHGAIKRIFEHVKYFSMKQLESLLDAIPAPFSAALQQTILKISIEHDIPGIVRILLARGLDTNRVTCQFKGRSITPLGLACKLLRAEIVSLIINSRANVDARAPGDFTTAVGYICFKLHEVVNMPKLLQNWCNLFQNLLIAGAVVRSTHLTNPCFWRTTAVIDVYTQYSRRPLSVENDDSMIPPSYRPFEMAVKNCGTEQALLAIKTMIGPIAMFGNDKLKFARYYSNTFGLACQKGNELVVEYFLGAGFEPGASSLLQAVKSNQQHMVRKLVEHGVDVDCVHTFPGETLAFQLCGRSAYGRDTTPFAEAITHDFQDLIDYFQSLGVMAGITENRRFHAALIGAASAGNIGMLRSLLNLSGWDRYSPLLSTLPPITFAVLNKHDEIVNLLMEWNFRPTESCIGAAIITNNPRLIRLFLTTAGAFPRTTLLTALATRFSNISITKLILATGGCVSGVQTSLINVADNTDDSRNRKDDNLASPVTEAIRRGDNHLLELLLDHGAPANEANGSNLPEAIMRGNERILRSLVSRGADPMSHGVLSLAAKHSGHLSNIFTALLEEIERPRRVRSPMFAAHTLRTVVRTQNENLTRRLAVSIQLNGNDWISTEIIRGGPIDDDDRGFLEGRSDRRTSPLGEAIRTRNCTIIQILLDAGADPNITASVSLHGKGRWTAISAAIYTGDLAIVQLLHKAGADLHYEPTLGILHTSLQLAADLGHSEIVQFLLKHGVNVNADPCLWGGGTALQMAAKSGNVGLAELLIQRGADINAPGSKYDGRTAFEAAAEHGRMDMLLLLYHQGVDLVSDGGKQVERALDLAEKSGQIAAKLLAEQLAAAAGLPIDSLLDLSTCVS